MNAAERRVARTCRVEVIADARQWQHQDHHAVHAARQ